MHPHMVIAAQSLQRQKIAAAPGQSERAGPKLEVSARLCSLWPSHDFACEHGLPWPARTQSGDRQGPARDPWPREVQHARQRNITLTLPFNVLQSQTGGGRFVAGLPHAACTSPFRFRGTAGVGEFDRARRRGEHCLFPSGSAQSSAVDRTGRSGRVLARRGGCRRYPDRAWSKSAMAGGGWGNERDHRG
jgi:hypothetical protein